MKMLLPVVLFLIGCHSMTDTVKPFIPGTYYASWKTAFSIAVDTMTIAAVSENGSEGYLITRRTHLDFIGAAKKREPEYYITKWLGSYYADAKTLEVNSNGRIISFDPSNKVLRMGNIIYRKL